MAPGQGERPPGGAGRPPGDAPPVPLPRRPGRHDGARPRGDQRSEPGAPAWWTSGPALEILLASSAIPGVFPPVELGGSMHVDGAVVQPVPVARAGELGARRGWCWTWGHRSV
ncbi:MAG: patatin-like phospholipase family protein [Acidimicrobiia bacterium]